MQRTNAISNLLDPPTNSQSAPLPSPSLTPDLQGLRISILNSAQPEQPIGQAATATQGFWAHPHCAEGPAGHSPRPRVTLQHRAQGPALQCPQPPDPSVRSSGLHPGHTRDITRHLVPSCCCLGMLRHRVCWQRRLSWAVSPPGLSLAYSMLHDRHVGPTRLSPSGCVLLAPRLDLSHTRGRPLLTYRPG